MSIPRSEKPLNQKRSGRLRRDLGNELLGELVQLLEFPTVWGLSRNRIPLLHVEGRGLVAERPKTLKVRQELHGLIQQETQIVRPMKRPSTGDQEPFEEFLEGLLEMERGVLAIVLLKSPWDPFEILTGLAEPLRRIA